MLSTRQLKSRKALALLNPDSNEVWQLKNNDTAPFKTCCCNCLGCRSGEYLFFDSEKDAMEFSDYLSKNDLWEYIREHIIEIRNDY